MYQNVLVYDMMNSVTCFRNSLGFSKCSQCPAPSMWLMWALGKSRLISGTSSALQGTMQLSLVCIGTLVVYTEERECISQSEHV